MLYIDTSSLLKVLLPEPGDDAVERAVAAESEVVVSQLAELEVEVQLRARRLAGALTAARQRRIQERLASLRDTAPFVFHPLPSTVFATALRQHRQEGTTHCRSLDRLHLAAMEELGIKRLMTHDARQMEAARALGFEVVTP